MLLQLAERPSAVRVSSYTRKAKVKAHTRSFPTLREHSHIDSSDPYIFFPDGQGGGMFIHESKFDSVPEETFKRLMLQLAPFQPSVQSGELSEPVFLADRASRRDRRERKKEAKTAKKEAKTQKKQAKAEAVKLKAESKAEKRAQGKGGVDWEKVKDVGGSLISKFTGKGDGTQSDSEPTIVQGDATPFYKKPAVLIGGAVLLGAGIYLATRKK